MTYKRVERPTFTTCPICYKRIEQNMDNGRPRTYCSERCKGKAKRRAMRDRDRRAILGVQGPDSIEHSPGVYTNGVMLAEGARVMCHVCGIREAERGSPQPVLCTVCATPRS